MIKNFETVPSSIEEVTKKTNVLRKAAVMVLSGVTLAACTPKSPSNPGETTTTLPEDLIEIESDIIVALCDSNTVGDFVDGIEGNEDDGYDGNGLEKFGLADAYEERIDSSTEVVNMAKNAQGMVNPTNLEGRVIGPIVELKNDNPDAKISVINQCGGRDLGDGIPASEVYEAQEHLGDTLNSIDVDYFNVTTFRIKNSGSLLGVNLSQESNAKIAELNQLQSGKPNNIDCSSVLNKSNSDGIDSMKPEYIVPLDLGSNGLGGGIHLRASGSRAAAECILEQAANKGL